MSKSPVSPTSLSPEELARLLTAAGGAGGKGVSAEAIRRDIEAGAPVGKDGRINLVHYAAWLVKEVQSGGR